MYNPFLKLCVLVFSLMLCFGCQSRTFEFKYISLESAEGSMVLEWMAKPPSGVKTNRKIPVKYKIEKQNYIVHIRLVEERNAKALVFTVIDKDDQEKYKLKGNHITDISSNSRYPGYDYYFLPPENSVGSILDFKIYNSKNELVDKERIPYEIKIGGSYVSYDSI